jgi:hypothetical protein
MNRQEQVRCGHLATSSNAQEVAVQLFRQTGEDHVVATNDGEVYRVFAGSLIDRVGLDKVLPNGRIVTVCTGEGGATAEDLWSRPERPRPYKTATMEDEFGD